MGYGMVPFGSGQAAQAARGLAPGTGLGGVQNLPWGFGPLSDGSSGTDTDGYGGSHAHVGQPSFAGSAVFYAGFQLPSGVDNTWALQEGRVYSLEASFYLLPLEFQVIFMFLAAIPGIFFQPYLIETEAGPRWSIRLTFLPEAIEFAGFSGPVDDFVGFPLSDKS